MAIFPSAKKSTPVSFYDPQSEAESKRKRAMADALIQSGSDELGNEKIGKYVLERSPLEYISKSAQSAYGQYLGSQADREQAEIDARRQKAISDALSGGSGQDEVISVLSQDPRTENAAIQMYSRQLQNQQPTGIQSGGFEGDIARAFQAKYIQDGMSPEEAAQRAVFDTAQSMRGAYNPVTGAWDVNQVRHFNGLQTPQVQTPQQPQVNMPQMPQVNQPMPQGNEGLLPPPSMGGGQPDMSLFQGSPQGSATQSSGNPRLDQARMEAEAKAQVDIQKAQAIAQQEGQMKAQADLPKSLDGANYTLSLIDQALTHPGLSESVGGTFGMRGRQSQAFPITEGQRSFQPIADQLRDRTFLSAFDQLRGAGAITEAEGQKATGAFFRMSQAQDEASYRSALQELKGIIQTGIERAKKSASMTPQQQAIGMIGVPSSVGSTTPTIPTQQANPYSNMSDDELRQRLMGGAR